MGSAGATSGSHPRSVTTTADTPADVPTVAKAAALSNKGFHQPTGDERKFRDEATRLRNMPFAPIRPPLSY